MMEVKLSVAIFIIALICMAYFVGLATATKTYLVCFILGNLLSLPATIMMVAGHRDPAQAAWKAIAIPAATIVLVAPAFPILLPTLTVRDVLHDRQRQEMRRLRKLQKQPNPPGD